MRHPWTLSLAAIALLAVGCGQPSSGDAAPSGPANETKAGDDSSPEGRLFEQLRGGAVQLQLAQDAVAEAYAEVNALKNEPDFGPETGEALTDLEAMLDSVGATLSELVSSPSKASVEADFGAADELRLKAIDAANDAHYELQECLGLVEGVLDQTGEHLRPRVDAVFEKIRTAQAEIESAVTTLGGVIAPPGGDE
ncbi:MAG: hypothetical protein H3C58_06730 [Fimbriimonadaceae bacterium]|nr:hypothetical protein [Fimbriimonadaceae bacterium]